MSKDNMYLQSLQTVLVSFALEPCSKKWWISHVVVELVQGGPSAAGSSVPGATEWDGLAGLVRVADPAAGSTLAREADSVEAGCSSCSSPLEGPFGSPKWNSSPELEGGRIGGAGPRLVRGWGSGSSPPEEPAAIWGGWGAGGCHDFFALAMMNNERIDYVSFYTAPLYTNNCLMKHSRSCAGLENEWKSAGYPHGTHQRVSKQLKTSGAHPKGLCSCPCQLKHHQSEDLYVKLKIKHTMMSEIVGY